MTLVNDLPGILETNLASLLMPGEQVLVKMKGAFKEALACTDFRVLILKAGFMTGQTFGRDAFQQPYGNISGVQVKSGIMSGYLEVSAGGMQNTAKSYWSSDKNSDPAKAPNCVSLTGKAMRDQFQQAATFILQKVSEVHAHASAPAAADPSDALRRLASLHEDGLLTDEEFAAKKAELLTRM